MQSVVDAAITIPMLFLDADGAGKEGLAVTAAARKAGTTTTVSGTVTERSDGAYDAAITLTSVGVWLFQGVTTIDGDAALWTETVQVVTSTQADPAAALAGDFAAIPAAVLTASPSDYTRDQIGGRIGLLGTAGNIVTTSPVSDDGDTLTLVKGDNHTNANSNPVTFTEPSAGPAWPTLTGLTPRLVISNRVNAAVVTVEGTVTVATGSGKQVRFDLTAIQTGALNVGNPAYRFAVSLPSLDRTLVRGVVVVLRDSSP